MKMIYTTTVKATGGREGAAQSIDGRLNVKLTMPKELGGSGAEGTNPEQMFGGGYAACFDSALRFVARGKKVQIGEGSAVTALVGLSARPEGGFSLNVSLNVNLPGLDRALAQELVDKAHQVCPYSNATRGNIDVQITLE